MGQTAAEKIAKGHQVEGPDRPLRPGDMVTLRPRHLLTHDNTAAVMKKFRAIGARRVRDPSQPVFALDHDVQNRSPAHLEKYRAIEAFAREQAITFHPAGTGIGHQVIVDHGFAAPGRLVVASDSHANLYGAVGALGTPVVRTDAAAIWAAGTFWWVVPRTVQVVLEGRLREGVSGKDVILTLCGMYASGEARNAAVEFAGPGVATLSVEARMTIANMTTEWGALAGWFPVDERTLAYLRARREAMAREGREPFSGEDLRAWAEDPPGPDPDASYAARITLDLGEVEPQVAGPDRVQASRALGDASREGIPIHRAYLLSCVNGRLEDLEAAARVIRGQHVAEGVSLYVAAASREIQKAAERSGAWKALVDAGATILPPGCGPCIGLGEGLLEPGETGISATNRNFKGRMGSREARCYLASPAVVAASAVAGRIEGPRELAGGGGKGRGPRRRFEALSGAGPAATEPRPGAAAAGAAADAGKGTGARAGEAGLPGVLRGRLVFVPQDHLNTDGIYGKDYTYREDMTPEAMARVVMENHDPGFAGRVAAGDVLVGGEDFGTGSSREQAATALAACGIRLIIAASFSQTYLRNAYNNGMPCVTCPELVAALRRRLAASGERDARTWIPGDDLEVDLAGGRIAMGGETYRFAPLGPVARELLAAGGIEALVRRRLASPPGS